MTQVPHLHNLFADMNFQFILGGNWFQELLKKYGPTFTPHHEYITIEFFKDGKVYQDFDLPRLIQNKVLSDLPCSFRITNLQLLDINVYRMCQKLEQKFGRSFTCNSYYTPGPERNCFDFHADNQVTYVCQILGEKEWIFPLFNNQIVSYSGQIPFSKELIADANFTSIHLGPGQELHVPYAEVHKVEIRGMAPSLHLTFGSFEHHQADLLQGILNFVIQEAKFDATYRENVTKENIAEHVARFKACVANISPDEFSTKFQDKMFGDALIVAKQGRSYKKIELKNQD